MTYPIQLSGLEGARVLVAGGGPIAAHKIDELLLAGAEVHVVTLTASDALKERLDRICSLTVRAARPEDVEGALLVVAATGDKAIDRALAAAARARGILVNVVDDPESSSFFAPAVIRRGAVTVTVSTGGASPLLSAQLKRVLEALLPRSLSPVAEVLTRARAKGASGLARKRSLLRALGDAAVARLVDRGDIEGAAVRMARIASEPEEPFPKGTVAIVGAGPGSRAHLTVRALDRIQRADVILHDALVEPEVLAEALPDTRIVPTGRRNGIGGVSEEDTIARMIVEARSGRRVVRLHGGDPMVFGRGGEEIDALEEAGIAFEIVPGVSAVLAAPAAAGIPLTVRGAARGFTVRTGHTSEGYAQTVALDPDEDTLVILMGLGAVRELMAGLVAEGRDPDTPAAVISHASRKNERVVRATIASLADAVERERVESPATIVVGEVARRAGSAVAAMAARTAQGAMEDAA